MVANPIRVLLIEDNSGDALLIEEALHDVPTPAFWLEQASRLGLGLERLTRGDIDVILLDLSLPDSHGLDTLIRACRHAPAIPIIVLTGLDDNVLEVRAVQAGAQDFLSKNALNGHLLARAIRYAIERKQAEERLRQTNAYLENLLNYANAPIIVWDPHFHITRFNHAFEFLTGRTEAEVVGQSIELLFPPDLAEHSMTLIRKTLQGERWETVEIKISHRSGSIRTVLWNSATLFAPDGQTPVATIAQGQDITERKQTEEALRASEAKYRLSEAELKQAQAVAQLGNWKWNIQTKEVSWSDEMYRIFGIDKNTFTGRLGSAIEKVIHPDDLHLVLPSNATSFVEKRAIEYRIIWPDGSIRHIWAEAGEAILGTDGSPIFLTGVAQDITERKQSEEALRKSEQRYRLLAENTTDVIWVLDPDTMRFLYVSPSVEQLLGYTPDEAMARPFAEILAPEIREPFLHRIRQQVASFLAQPEPGVGYRNEVVHLRKDGSAVWTETVNHYYLNHLAGRVEVQGVSRDITEQKQAAEQVQRYEFIANTATESMTLINREHVFEAVNDAYCRARGRSRAELIGQSVAEVWGEAHYRTNIRPYLEQCFTGQIVRYEDSFTFEQGEPRYYQVGMYPYRTTPDGPVRSAVVVNFDITDVKRAEAQREAALAALRDLNAVLEQRVADRTRQLTEANVQLAQLDRLKDQFISRISHELRTPLTNIIIYLELLETGKPEKHARYRQVLNEQTALLQKLIENLLEVTQHSVNLAELRIVPTDLNHLAASLAADTAPRAAQRDLMLHSEWQPDLPLVNADPLLLAQALSHLASNALNYTPAGGTIDLRTAQVIEQGATWITFTIRDTGPGITPDELPHIFERFYRGRAAANYKTPGAGVGLSLSRDILTSLGGRLTVMSAGEPDAQQGATFVAWLKPAAEAQP